VIDAGSTTSTVTEAALRLGDRFGVVFLVCVTVAIAAVVLAFLACRALWRALQAKETEHRAERKEDREANLAVLEKLSASTTSGMAELGRKLDRVEDLVARPRSAA